MNVIKKPVNIVDVTYARTGGSVHTDAMGMREMQQRVFAKRDAQHLLVKAPPASGKSRALMFVALDKLYNQGRKKVIVAVPERSIGASFSSTELSKFGFFADWEVKPEHNLCDPGSSQGKVGAFIDFLNGPDAVLISTHATLRFACEKLAPEAFNDTVLAIDEFHHVSADIEASRLGALLRDVMNGSDVHIVAMTGSYFRGDSIPVLSTEDEARFTPVTFNYYDQLNGYEYLHSLGIGHHFYQGRYTDAIGEVLNLNKKTIVHIPNVNSGESTKDKIEEVGFIIDSIGHVESTDLDTGIISIRRSDTGEILRLADLVDDTDQKKRADTLHYLSTVASKDRDAVDVILALGMAKEGFDWPFAEHALTVGYRASLTEVIQIIGRVTRDSPGKAHAQFTNLIAEPDASQTEVKVSVNNMLKAITASLLMEQVLAQNFEFKTKRTGDDEPTPPGVVKVKGFKEPSTERVKQIVETDLNDLKATILQDDTFAKAAAGSVDAETTNRVLIPKIIRERYPDLDESQVEELRQQVVVDSVIKNGEVREVGDKRFIKMSEKFVNIDDININLIDSVNPFQRAFEVISKSVTPSVLRIISDAITAARLAITEEEALTAWPRIQQWAKVNGRKPDVRSDEPTEKRYAEVLLFLQRKKQERDAAARNTDGGRVVSASESIGPIDVAFPTSIEAILDSDFDGLLDVPEKPAKVTSADRLKRAFLEVVEFRRTHGRVPSSTTREIAERKLGARLDGILASDDKIAALRPLDEFGLLDTPEAPASIDDLLGGDDFDLLGDESGLLDVSDLPVRRQIHDGGEVARREKAQDFEQFEPLFKQKHTELRAGASKLLPYPGLTHIVEGAFFVLNGLMLFVAEVGETEYRKTTVRENKRERLRCIFENGTESSMYRQSLGIRLSDEDGQVVVPTEVPEILTDDRVSGYVYVLRSLSDDPQIANIKDLHKIGFTRDSVEKRIKNAEKFPTYLMAPVDVVASYRTYNLKVSALENLLHRLFADVRLDVSQADRKGRDYNPSEWFVVPRDVIDQAIDLIISGEIISFVYDANAQKLVYRG